MSNTTCFQGTATPTHTHSPPLPPTPLSTAPGNKRAAMQAKGRHLRKALVRWCGRRAAGCCSATLCLFESAHEICTHCFASVGAHSLDPALLSKHIDDLPEDVRGESDDEGVAEDARDVRRGEDGRQLHYPFYATHKSQLKNFILAPLAAKADSVSTWDRIHKSMRVIIMVILVLQLVVSAVVASDTQHSGAWFMMVMALVLALVVGALEVMTLSFRVRIGWLCIQDTQRLLLQFLHLCGPFHGMQRGEALPVLLEAASAVNHAHDIAW